MRLSATTLLLVITTTGCLFLPSPESPTSVPPGWYRVSVERAVIQSTKETGKPWDVGLPGADPPDTYVQIIFEDEIFRTPVVQNTFQPMWVGSFDALLGVTPGPATARFLLWDRDVDADDPIGEITVDLYEVFNAGGSLIVNHFGRVSELSLSIRYEGPAAPTATLSK